MTSQKFDVIIIGAGIVGLATAMKILEFNPGQSVAIVDKEKIVAHHQTGHNSGVIHSGIYYKPGSAKALNCQRGYQQLIKFCERESIPFDLCGKIIVATEEKELPQLATLYERGLKNGLSNLQQIGPTEINEIEPHVKGIAAIHVPQAGIIDYKKVAQRYKELIESAGGTFFLGSKVTSIAHRGEGKIVQAGSEELHCKMIVNCAGLYADKICNMTGQLPEVKILPFRGEYYELVPERRQLINHLVYPVPDPNFPFLGVHFTRMINGGIEAGPNAVLAFAREGYSRWKINGSEFYETITYSGFISLAKKHWRMGLGELHRSFSKRAFVTALRHLVPSLEMSDLHRSDAGVRATACDAQGNLADDYLIQESPSVLNICNAPSPAATSSLSIGQTLAEKVLAQLNA